MHAFTISIFIAMVFLPAMILLYMVWSVWVANKRPKITDWRLTTFKWGLICAPVSTAALAPGAGHYLWTWGPPDMLLGVANWCGLLLWVFSLSAAFVGRGKARVLLGCWAVLAMLGLLAIYFSYP
jgi:hypothetical protein